MEGIYIAGFLLSFGIAALFALYWRKPRVGACFVLLAFLFFLSMIIACEKADQERAAEESATQGEMAIDESELRPLEGERPRRSDDCFEEGGTKICVGDRYVIEGTEIWRPYDLDTGEAADSACFPSAGDVLTVEAHKDDYVLLHYRRVAGNCQDGVFFLRRKGGFAFTVRYWQGRREEQRQQDELRDYFRDRVRSRR